MMDDDPAEKDFARSQRTLKIFVRSSALFIEFGFLDWFLVFSQTKIAFRDFCVCKVLVEISTKFYLYRFLKE